MIRAAPGNKPFPMHKGGLKFPNNCPAQLPPSHFIDVYILYI